MKKLVLKIKNRYNAFIRKEEIGSTLSEMEYLEEILYQALTGRGSLTGPQRMKVLKNLVDRVRIEKTLELESIKIKNLESEAQVDTIGLINLFF